MRERPRREDVADAIEAARGNLSRAAASLGCSRTALYDWIWKYGLQHLAGLDTAECQRGQAVGVSVKLHAPEAPTLSGNMSAEATIEDVRFAHNVKVRDSLWTRAAHVAVDRKITMSDAVEEALSEWLARLAARE